MFFAFLILIIAVAYLVVANKKGFGGFGQAKFVLKSRSILTDREQGCYWRLVHTLGPEYVVFCQVAYSQILKTQGGTNKQRFGLNSTMKQKVADFLICDKALNMLAIIELDDSSHRNKAQADKKRDDIVRSAGLLVYRFPAVPNQDLIQKIAQHIRLSKQSV